MINMGKLAIPSIIATTSGGGGGGGGAVWGSITGTLSNQTDLQNALDDKVGIVDDELKLTDGQSIIVETEDDSNTEIFSDAISIDATGTDASEEASLYMVGTVGATATITDGSNQIDIKANSTDGATITKTENNVTKSVLWEDQQSIKTYHAPSATLDAILGVIIPNVDACTEQGLYNVDYSFESDGATITSNALLEVSETSMSGVSAIAQNLLINVGTELVYCTRNYISNTFTSWEGKNIPAELAKCLQNTATGTNSLTIGGIATNKNDSINIGNQSRCTQTGCLALGHYAYAQSSNANAIGNGTQANGYCSTAVGYSAYANNYGSLAIGSGGPNQSYASADNSIQIGNGTNTNEKTLQVYTYQMLDGNTGKIPSDRMTKVIELTTTSVQLASDNIYNGAELASVTFTLPATVPVNFTAQLNFTSGATATVLTAPNTINFEGDDCTGSAFTPVASKRYQVLIASDGVNVNGYVIGR